MSHVKQNYSQGSFKYSKCTGAVILEQGISQWITQHRFRSHELYRVSRALNLNNKPLTQMEMSSLLDLGLRRPHTLRLFTLILSDVSCLLDIVLLGLSSRFRSRHLFPAKNERKERERKKQKKTDSALPSWDKMCSCFKDADSKPPERLQAKL